MGTYQHEQIERRWRRHHCVASKTAGYQVFFNDYGARVENLPGISEGCPFCWTHYLMMRENWYKRYWRLVRVASPEEVAPAVAEMLHRLERPGWPENGIVNHFGPYVSVRGLGIHVNRYEQHYTVLMNQTLHRRPAKLHVARAEAVATALTTGIKETWNGNDGSEGISVVLNRLASPALHRALDNYLAQKDVFSPSATDKAGYKAFDKWYEAPL